jgi:uncharacterized membrane protein YdjX (TVP38/TMEM64 family)
MKVFKLLYNSFIWGIIVAILAFQSEWLEMRVNIGIFVPLVMALCLIIRILLRKVKKENLLELSLKGTIINLLVCIAISLGILGVERIQVVPASILREGLKATSLSFNSVNMIILLIVIGGLVFFLFNNEEVEMKNIFKGIKGKIISILVIICLYFFIPFVRVNVNQAINVLKTVDVNAAREYILSFGIWAPAVSFLLMILQSVVAPLPAFIITFANAGLFGWVKGAILSWSSAMAGAALCYYIARLLGRDVVEKLTSRTALEKVDEFFERYGKYAVLIARLLPFISFDIVSYAAGLTSMSFWSFFIATGVGQLPATIVYSYIGGMLTGTVKTFVIGLLMLFALSTLIVLIKKMWDDKKKGSKVNI